MAPVSFLLQAFTVLPTSISDADATHLVGMCTACRRAESDPLRMLQLEGVSDSISSSNLKNLVNFHSLQGYRKCETSIIF